MKRTLVRYKTRPDAADQNAGLIEKVFEELKATKPAGVRYLSLRLDDDTFIHFVETEEGSTRFRLWMPSRRSRAEFANVALSRRWPVMPPLSAIIGCCRRTEFPEAQ